MNTTTTEPTKADQLMTAMQIIVQANHKLETGFVALLNEISRNKGKCSPEMAIASAKVVLETTEESRQVNDILRGILKGLK